MNDVYNIWIESRNELLNTIRSLCEMILQQELAAKLSTHTPEPSRRFNYICYDDDDDYDYEESTIPLNEIISQLPPSIVITTSPLVLPIEDPEDSLIMGNKELNTIPEKESDEFIKSSVEDLILIPSESEDTSRSDSKCILPSCDYFSPIDVPEEKSVTFSNPLFNSNDDFTSSGDNDVNPLIDEVLEKIERKDPYDSNLDEPDLLVTPLSNANKDECFDSGGDDDELMFWIGFTDELPLKENDDLFDLEPKNDDWKKILIAPDLEASRAHGFVHLPLELQYFAYGNPIS
nr:hypothetical protein [Tanacetum cinerariifolium]